MILSFFIAFLCFFWQTRKHFKKTKGAKTGVYTKKKQSRQIIDGSKAVNDSKVLKYKLSNVALDQT
jgi:hypothetical protein